MKIVDLNILLYAVNTDADHHAVLHDWWESALSGDEPIGLTWVVLLGFLRLSTNARVFPTPLSAEQAIEKIESWLGLPNTKLVPENDQHWRMLRSLLEQSGTAGNLTTDAHLASMAITNGAALVSCDTDFARFQHLRWENPIARHL